MTKLEDLFQGAADYGALYRAYRESEVKRKIHDKDLMIGHSNPRTWEYYFEVGEDALRIICGQLMQNRRPAPQSILDLPCGHGRVMRHLRVFFPEAEIVACDLYHEMVDFCVKEFGVTGAYSNENFDEFELGRSFDLIWCGSLLTHLPAPLFKSCLRFMVRHLSDQGMAIATLHGRRSLVIQKIDNKYLPDPQFAPAEADMRATGFGYVDYNNPTLFHAQEQYGITLTKPSWVIGELERNPDIRILSFAEMEWVDHQDVVAFERPGIPVDLSRSATLAARGRQLTSAAPRFLRMLSARLRRPKD